METENERTAEVIVNKWLLEGRGEISHLVGLIAAALEQVAPARTDA